MTRPLCIECNFNLAGISTKTDKGITYRKKCDRCRRGKENVDARRETKRLKKRPWTAFKKDHCEGCGFKAAHPCQLSVDHIDGSKENNNPSNYKTLCHNCHALKTMINRDWLNLNYRERYGQDVLQQVSQKPSVGG